MRQKCLRLSLSKTVAYLLFATLLSFINIANAQELSPPDPTAVQALKKVGGNVIAIAQNDPRLDVTLNLSGKQVDDSVLPNLQKLPGLVWLNLSTTKITNDGLAQIAPISTLEKLHLERTEIGDEGLAHLKDLHELRYLNLYATKVTDAGIPHLKSLKKLEHLYIWQSGITDAGIADLKSALPDVKVIGAAEQLIPPPADDTKPEEPKP